jgi:ArsR family transcriptional regulator
MALPHVAVDNFPCFQYYRNMAGGGSHSIGKDVARYADMFAAMGTEPRLRILRLLLSAHPNGLVVGDIQAELEIPNSTLSHHLDKLKNEELVTVKREGTFLRCLANTESLRELLGFLYAECCTRSKAIKPEKMIQVFR